MKKILFEITGIENVGFTASESTRTMFLVNLDRNNQLEVVPYAGRHPFTEEVNAAIAVFLKEAGPLKRYVRRYKYRFCYKTGMSGCQDTYIEYEKVKGFPTRKFLCHQTAYGKTEGFKVFLYDFLDLAVTAGFLKVKDNEYTVPEGADKLEGASIRVIRPRNTEKEDGWSYSCEYPKEIVPLSICRE